MILKDEVSPTESIRKIRHHLTCVIARGFRDTPIDMESTDEQREEAFRSGCFQAPLVRQVLDLAQHLGLSGEDAMTLLAYEALKNADRYYKLIFQQACLSPGPAMLMTAEKSPE
jgi:hypothetical protein